MGCPFFFIIYNIELDSGVYLTRILFGKLNFESY